VFLARKTRFNNKRKRGEKFFAPFLLYTQEVIMATCAGEAMSFCRSEWGTTTNGVFSMGALKRKFRWLFHITNITTSFVDSAQPLPCMKAARPKITLKEMQAEHLNETISFPSKPEWQPIQIMLYDRCISTQNPIFTWLKQQYNPGSSQCSQWYPCLDSLSFKTCANLQLLDGCGNVVEAWVLQNCYPQSIDWGDLDMTNYEVVTVEFTLRYDRAFQVLPGADMPHALYSDRNADCDNYRVCPDTTCVQPVPTGGGTLGQIPNISITPPSRTFSDVTPISPGLSSGPFNPITNTNPSIPPGTLPNPGPPPGLKPLILPPDFIMLQ
jgi:hypothetical protein